MALYTRLICVPGCKIGEISAEQMSTAVKDELEVYFQGVFPLPRV